MTKRLQVPAAIDSAMKKGATMALSISGGKDSQAMLVAVLEEYTRRPEWTGDLVAVHADLGKAEWGHGQEDAPWNTMATVKAQAEEYGLSLTIVTRKEGEDLVDRIQARMEKLQGTGKPFWPSSAARYCTSDLKRDPIDAWLRSLDTNLVVNVMGLRAEESSARARKAGCAIRSRITTKDLKKAEATEAVEEYRLDGGRVALDWNPILEWKEEDVWEALGSSMEDLARRRSLWALGARQEAMDGWNAHVAYLIGNERLSCSLCVLATDEDLANGAEYNPALFELYTEWERETGMDFQKDRPLSGLFSRLERKAA